LETIEIARKVIAIELAAVERLRDKIDDSFTRAVELIYRSRGRVVVSGLGKSGAIARKMAATFSSTGTPAYFLHATEGLHGDLGIVNKEDVVIAISKSGNTAEINQLIPVFKKLGVPVIAMTGNSESPLARNSDVILDVSVEEEACPNDLAPTASTTVSLVLGDALAVALLDKRNFTRDDFAFLHPAGSLGKKLLWRVDDIMEKNDRIAILKPDDIMKKATLEMANKRGICSVVDDDERIVGVVTTGDLNRLLVKNENFFEIKVSEVMNTSPKTIFSGTLATKALAKMERYQIIAMPVINEDGKVMGVIHFHDILDSGVS
jgi:arabinose-5-phosphate isomerase